MSIVTVREFHDELSGMEMLRENGRDKGFGNLEDKIMETGEERNRR